ncbi:MAG: DNA mismatch endonuclease Vsr [Planctomycetes bacterium]|nr:DNA mismatch endonuclease Vsr [Planctomycetota bacterium]MBL7040004.1 DNA mismatch endonuclease Vsr [Pirellulaceae bacterium]
MADRFSARKRRRIMQTVRTRDTAPEQALSTALRELGLTFEQNAKELPGTPDFYFPDSATVVFVHGCFWHGHQACAKGRNRPKTNKHFWKNKLKENLRRDRRVARQLRAMGLSVYTVWECEIKRSGIPTRLRDRLLPCE